MQQIAITRQTLYRHLVPDRELREDAHTSFYSALFWTNGVGSCKEAGLPCSPYWLDRMGASDRLRPSFGKTKVLYFACLDEFLDGTRDVLDGNIGINAVLVKQIYRVDVQALQRRVGYLLDVLRLAVQALPSGTAIGVQIEAELCGNDGHSRSEDQE
jgi:hypothetical protein